MPVARMAVQFHNGTATNEENSNSDWYPTGQTMPTNISVSKDFTGKEKKDGKKVDKDRTTTVPNDAWGHVLGVTFGVEREYGGIGSSGGPQHSGRPDHKLIHISRSTDKISPHLFLRCCNGMQLKRVIIYYPEFGDPAVGGLVIYAEDTHVVSFDTSIEKSTTTKTTITPIGAAPPMPATEERVTTASSQSLGSTYSYDKITILYTSISFKVLNSGYLGWNTGTETSFKEGPEFPGWNG